MVFNALQINSYVFSEECKWKKNLFGQRKVAFAECELELSVDHITSPPHWPSSEDVWVRACNVWLPQGPSYSMNVVVRIGKQRLYKPRDCHQILTSSRTVRLRQNDDLRFCQPCESVNGEVDGSGAPVNFLKESFADEETCRDRYHRPHGTMARPASGHSCRPTSLQWRTRRSAFKSSLPVDPLAVVSAAACMQQPAEIGLRLALGSLQRTWWSTSTLSARPAQLLRFLKFSNCACVKISPSVWPILGDDQFHCTTLPGTMQY